MFARRATTSDSFSKNRAGRAISKQKRSFRENAVATATARRVERARKSEATSPIARLDL